jgi:hypothetical protein
MKQNYLNFQTVFTTKKESQLKQLWKEKDRICKTLGKVMFFPDCSVHQLRHAHNNKLRHILKPHVHPISSIIYNEML